MKSYLKLFSPAKVNLFFKVLFKRQDGYHEIASLYQAINLGDTLFIRISDKDKFRCDNFNLEFNSTNLIFKAYDSFKQKTKKSFCVDIVLDKKVPVQAGLGGGSSDAATTLFGLNHLIGCPLSNDEMINLCKSIGSDVAFFFSSGSALCSGRGEIFKDLPYKKIQFYLAVPSFGVSTALVYKNVDLSLLQPSDIEKSIRSFYDGDLFFFNDLESAAFSLEPRLLKVKVSLEKMGFEKVVMTGSGSAFMCFGKIKNPSLPEVRFFKTENILKNFDSWFLCP